MPVRDRLLGEVLAVDDRRQLVAALQRVATGNLAGVPLALALQQRHVEAFPGHRRGRKRPRRPPTYDDHVVCLGRHRSFSSYDRRIKKTPSFGTRYTAGQRDSYGLLPNLVQ
jgi:hypothetical protein